MFLGVPRCLITLWPSVQRAREYVCVREREGEAWSPCVYWCVCDSTRMCAALSLHKSLSLCVCVCLCVMTGACLLLRDCMRLLYSMCVCMCLRITYLCVSACRLPRDCMCLLYSLCLLRVCMHICIYMMYALECNHMLTCG